MAKKPDADLLSAVYRTVVATPGMRPSQVAAQVGVKHKRIYKILPQMEQIETLLYEDDGGKLYPMDEYGRVAHLTV